MSALDATADVIVIGGGIAGAGAAYELAASASVVVPRVPILRPDTPSAPAEDLDRLGITASESFPEPPAQAARGERRRPQYNFVRNGTFAMTIRRLENGPRYCRVLSHNGTVYLSGMTADDKSRDVVQQTRDTLAKIDHYLALADSDKRKLLTAVIWLRDIADFDRMNSVWDEWIDRSAMPVRATVEARLSGDDYRVEIMVTAAQ